MTDMYVEGPDALKLLTKLGINTFNNFSLNKAKQFVPCNYDGYVIVPGGVANGGGERINQYTLAMDINLPAATAGSWHALWQTRTNNQDDASLFIRPGGGIGISGSYHGALLPDTWYRLVFTFDLVTRTLKKYTNGVLAGQPGSRRVIRDRFGRVIEDVGATREPHHGSDLALSIDAKSSSWSEM